MIWIKEGFSKVQEVTSPFNVVNFIVTVTTLAPGLGAFWLAGKLQQMQVSKSTPSKPKTVAIAVGIVGIVVLAFIFIIATREAIRDGVTSSSSPGGAQSGGELFPYYRGTEFRFVGSYFGDHVYVRPSGTVQFENDKLAADTFIVTEQFASIARKPSTKKIAMVPDLDAVGDLREADFFTPPSGTLLEKALQVYISQRSNGRIRSGRTRDWLYVDLEPDLRAVYVSSTDGAEHRHGLEIIPMLSIKEQRCLLFIDYRNRRFAPVNTDLFGTPQEEIEYRPIRDGQMEDRISEIIRER